VNDASLISYPRGDYTRGTTGSLKDWRPPSNRVSVE
jgi:hypothetical protein